MFGSGNYLGIEVNTSQSNRTLVLSTVDPYFTIDGISRAFDLYYRTTRPLNSQGEEYQLVTPGVGDPLRRAVHRVRHGVLRHRLRANRDPRCERIAEQLSSCYRENFGERQQQRAADDRLGARPARQRAGARPPAATSASTSSGAPLGDIGTLRANLQYQQYFPLTKRFTLGAQRARSAGARAWATSRYPIFKNFYGGGLGSVRGFDQGSLGPVDVTGAYIGGNRRLNLNGELYVPVPGTGNDRTLAPVRLVDAGNVWGEEREGRLPTACVLGRHRPELDLAGRAAEAELRHADPQEAGR